MNYCLERGRWILKKLISLITSISLASIFLAGCSNSNETSSKKLSSSSTNVSENASNIKDEKKQLEPTIPKLSTQDIIGADMAEIDYASSDKVIFHGYFGLFVYDLNNLSIFRSLDLQSINCSYTQGDSYCNVEVSTDGNKVQLHPNDSEKMYVYSISDNTLFEEKYVPMENSFNDNLVEIGEAIGRRDRSLSCNAVKLDNGEYGYLTASNGTIESLNYIRGDMIYSLFNAK